MSGQSFDASVRSFWKCGTPTMSSEGIAHQYFEVIVAERMDANCYSTVSDVKITFARLNGNKSFS